MSKLLAVFGATGHQGTSVINHILNDSDLSQKYKIRALTRDVHSDKAKKLPQAVEVLATDMEDQNSVQSALQGVHTVFIVTVPSFGLAAMETELNTIRMLADVSLAQGVQYIIFSTLPAVSEISNGKFKAVTPFDAKAEGEKYIRSLTVKSAFVSLAFYMDNFQTQPFIAPKRNDDGVWVLKRPLASQSKIPLIDAIGDAGKFVGAILAQPDKYQGKTFSAATAFYTFEEIVTTLTKVLGQKFEYEEVSLDEFRSYIPFPDGADIFTEGNAYGGEFGYFGSNGEEEVAWAVANAHGKLSSFEAFLRANPPKFE